MITLLIPVIAVVPVQASATPPTVASAYLVTNRFIEINWAGTDYINGAGASKENNMANHRGNFEVRLNGTVLALTAMPTRPDVSTHPVMYWNITNMSLHGVRVNQNKTTLQLQTALTNTQMTAVQNGSSTLDVRITGGVTASTLTGNTPASTTGSVPANGVSGMNPAANIGAPGAAANTTTRHTVVHRPYYTNTVTSSDGVAVRGSEFVLLSTVQEAARQVDVILSAAPASLNSRLASTSSFVVFGPGEHSYNIPEHRYLFLRDAWNRAEGYGGNVSATSAAGVTRQHILPSAQRPYDVNYRTGYANESILAHEFGHGIMNAMNANSVTNPGSSSNMNREIDAIYNAVIRMPENPANPTGRLRWQGATAGSLTYMSSNSHEFVATAVSIWFDAMAESQWQTNGRGMVNFREDLRLYCPQTYNFFTRILPEQKVLSEAWSSGISSSLRPVAAVNPPEPTGRFGPSVKLKSALADNPAGSGLQTYIPFNAANNYVPDVELWWDYNTDLMKWHLDPDENEQYFRIRRKLRSDYTQNPQRDNLVLMPQGGNAVAGRPVVLAQSNANDQSQQWKFVKQANGNFIIVNRANEELALVLRDNSTASGTRIELGGLTAQSRFWIVDGVVPDTFGATPSEPDPILCEVCGEEEDDCVCVYCDECEELEEDCICIIVTVPDFLYISAVSIAERWIEITNPTDRAISTKGLYLSDEHSDAEEYEPFAWQMPSFVIQSGLSVRVTTGSEAVYNGLKHMKTNFVLDTVDIVRLYDAAENRLWEFIIKREEIPQ